MIAERDLPTIISANGLKEAANILIYIYYAKMFESVIVDQNDEIKNDETMKCNYYIV